MLNKVLFFSWMGLLFCGALLAQTSSINLAWDQGTESDLYLYRVFRSGSPNAATQIDSIHYPAHDYSDKTFRKGVLYFYRLKAVDLSLNASDFSSEVSAAVPKVSGLSGSTIWPADTVVSIQLDSHVLDPDNADNTIVWSITGASKLKVAVANRVATITTPANWSGQETLTFKATDPQGFNDLQKWVIKSTTGATASAPIFSSIPAQSLDEDGQKTVKLSDYVTDTDSDVNQLTFATTQVNSVNLTINKDVLTIKPAANWNGSVQTIISVTDQDGLTDQTNMTININPVNDAPILTDLPSLTMVQDSTMPLDLSPYVSDIDNNTSQLQWQFLNFNHLSLVFDDATDKLTITSPSNWSGFEYVIVQVSDPLNAMVSDTLIVRVTSSASQAPKITALPTVSFEEDHSTSLEMNGYVNDPDDPVENLYWRGGFNPNVQVSISQSNHVATFAAVENWFGSTSIWIYVSDPSENIDSALVTVSVTPVNDPPVIKALPGINLSSNTHANLDLKKYSSDIDNVVSELNWQPANSQNVSISISNGIASFTVSDLWFGQEKINLYASDPSGARDTALVTVYRQDITVAPRIANLDLMSMDEDSEKIIMLDDYVSDPDNTSSDLVWTLTNDQTTFAQIDAATRQLTIHPAANWNGFEKLFLKVADPQGHVDFDTLNVEVRAVNDPPQIAAIPLVTMLANTIYTLSLDNFIIEPDGWQDLAEITVLAPTNSFIGDYLDVINHQLTFFAPSGFIGRETFLLRVTDQAGEQAVAVFTVEVADKLIRNLQIAFLGAENNISVNWQTRLPSIDKIQYGETASYGIQSEADATYSTFHQQELAGLKENTTYHFRMISEAIDGSVAYSADSIFVTGTEGGINVFPIPYQVSLDKTRKGIFFTNLPVSSRIAIYNLFGEPVFVKNDLSNLYRWLAVNNAGKQLSSGLYMYVVRDAGSKRVASGKIVIIR